jgi:ribonuclease HII
MKRHERPQGPLSYETGLWGRGLARVAGVDEVGRGPLAGPVVAAAVVLVPDDGPVEGVRDSKVLSAVRRFALDEEIHACASAIGIGAASVSEIDRLGIAPATALAMRRALFALPEPAEHVVVDGRPVRGLDVAHEAVVGGDALIHSVSCASIVAKVCRDRLMHRLADRYPVYGWHSNVGYGTRQHLEALKRFGPSPHHRRTFRGVQLGLEF